MSAPRPASRRGSAGTDRQPVAARGQARSGGAGAARPASPARRAPRDSGGDQRDSRGDGLVGRALWLAACLVLLLTACGEGVGDGSSATAPGGEPAGSSLVQRAVLPTPRLELDLSGPGWSLWLDDAAAWEDDALHAPPVDVAGLPARPPSAGWDVLASEGLPVSVPSSVETWTWDQRGDHRGVSWWRRALEVPAGLEGRRLVLAFESVRLRAEVFVDGALVGYDAVGLSPFEVDVSAALRSGGTHELAVRVTDPGGNLDWIDHTVHHWGRQPIPPSHGFGGLLGGVALVVSDPVHVADLWIANTPEPRTLRATVEIANASAREARRWLTLAIHDDLSGREVWRSRLAQVAVGAGERTSVSPEISVPGAQLWDLDSPHLYRFSARLDPLDDELAGGAPRAGTSDTANGAANGTAPNGAPNGAADGLANSATAGAASSAANAAPRASGSVDTPTAVAPLSAVGPDAASVRFGFRWFAPDGLGDEAVFRLNGRRVVLKSAISWGFWPVTGAVPSDALARRQVESARALGLNMLNHHRTPAAPGLLDVQDELGLLAHAEPGGHWCQGGDALTFALARERWRRLVVRDRSHPSLVIRNLINEATVEPDERLRDDLALGHALDPSRTLTFTSAWDDRFGAAAGLHYRPWDELPHEQGWSDVHDAAGPGVDRDRFYTSASEHRGWRDDRAQIVFLGEEGAIGTPPRLGALAAEVERRDAAGLPRGWDGSHWLARRDALARFLARPAWAAAFPDVDAFTGALADVAYDFHARALSAARVGDVVDGYVINGWEEERFENHSGLVDVWRQPKGTPAVLAQALSPLHLSVRLARRVHEGSWSPRPGAHTRVTLDADVHLVDEVGLSGPHTLVVSWEAPDRDEPLAQLRRAVTVSDGEVFGELLAEGLSLAAVEDTEARTTHVVARLYADGADPARDAPLVTGREQVFLVDWRRPPPPGGALLTGNDLLASFWGSVFGASVPALADRTAEPDTTTGVLAASALVLREPGPVDWLLVSDIDPEPRRPITALFAPREAGDSDDDPTPGVRTSWFPRHDLSGPATVVLTPGLGADVPEAGPVPGVGGLQYGLRQDAVLVPRESGDHRLHVASAGGVRLWLDDALVLDAWDDDTEGLRSTAALPLVAGRSLRVRLEHRHFGVHRRVDVSWSTPSDLAPGRALAAELLRRVEQDGTTLLVLDHTDRWARALHDVGDIGYRGTLVMGRYWMGGGFVARPHAALGGLVPAPTALAMPFQELVHYGRVKDGLLLGDDAETLVACVSDHQARVGSAVAILRRGKGRLLLCTLDVAGAVDTPPGAGGTARELLANLVHWAAGPGHALSNGNR